MFEPLSGTLLVFGINHNSLKTVCNDLEYFSNVWQHSTNEVLIGKHGFLSSILMFTVGI